MWAQKTQSGKWQYVERYTDPLTMKQKKVSVTLDGNSRQDRKTAMYILDEKIRKQSSPVMESVTLYELKEDYIEWKRQNLKEQTAVNSEFKMNTIVRLIGDVRLDKLTAPYVRKCLKGNPTTYNERVTRFKAMMRWAYQNDYIADISFIDKLQTLKDTAVRVKVKDKFLEHEEIEKLLPQLPEHWALLTRFLLLTGLRIGEAVALDVADVDTEIHVTKTYSPPVKKITSTKTEMSDRCVFIQDELRECINEIDNYRRRVCRDTGKVISIFFPTPKGERIQQAAYCKAFKTATLKTLGRTLTPHSLRHSHTALLAEAGIPLSEISARLGHADSRITRDVYMHVTQRMKDARNERLRAVRIM